MNSFTNALYLLKDKIMQAREEAAEHPLEPVFIGLDSAEAMLVWMSLNDFINKTAVQCNLFDERVVYPNCTVEIFRNSLTGDESVGWWRNETEDSDSCGPVDDSGADGRGGLPS